MTTCCSNCGNALPGWHLEISSQFDFCSEQCAAEMGVDARHLEAWRALQAKHAAPPTAPELPAPPPAKAKRR